VERILDTPGAQRDKLIDSAGTFFFSLHSKPKAWTLNQTKPNPKPNGLQRTAVYYAAGLTF
jgi:hypothetical protein